MSLLKKIKSFLTEAFNNPYTPPEREVVKEMEAEGWTFDGEFVIAPYTAAYIPIIKTPAGENVTGSNATEEARALYLETVKNKRQKLEPR